MPALHAVHAGAVQAGCPRASLHKVIGSDQPHLIGRGVRLTTYRPTQRVAAIASSEPPSAARRMIWGSKDSKVRQRIVFGRDSATLPVRTAAGRSRTRFASEHLMATHATAFVSAFPFHARCGRRRGDTFISMATYCLEYGDVLSWSARSDGGWNSSSQSRRATAAASRRCRKRL